MQFTPCVERTTLSCDQRPRYDRSQARSFATSWLQPSALTGPRRRNRCASSSALPRARLELADARRRKFACGCSRHSRVRCFRVAASRSTPHYRATICAASPPTPTTSACSSFSTSLRALPALERATGPRAEPDARPAPVAAGDQRATPVQSRPSIGDVARYLLLQHHSAVGLVDRAEAAGLVRRERDPEHRSTVRLSAHRGRRPAPVGAVGTAPARGPAARRRDALAVRRSRAPA